MENQSYAGASLVNLKLLRVSTGVNATIFLAPLLMMAQSFDVASVKPDKSQAGA